MKKYFYILSVFFFSILGYGQVSLISETSTRDFELNEPFKLNIGLEITGNHLEQETPLKLPDLSKFNIIGNASEVFSFIDPNTGAMVKQVVYQIILEPKQAGKVKIGSALVQVNGKIYKSEPFEVLVKEKIRRNLENQSARDMHISMEVNNNQLYPYEPIVVTLKAHSRNLNNFRKINLIKLPFPEKDIHSIALKNQDIEMGESHSQTIAAFILFPEKSGNLTIPPALAKFSNEKLASNSIKVNVNALPESNSHHFNNAVGHFTLDIISQKEVEINKPFDVFVKISGEGNLPYINLPKILKSEDYDIFKPKKTINTQNTPQGVKGEVTEHYILIAKKAGEISLNIEDFSYFNPKTKNYEKLHKQYIINSLNESIKKENINNPLEEIIDDTGHILKKVDLSPLAQTEEEEKGKGLLPILLGTFGIVLLGILSIILLKRKRKKQKFKYQNPTKIITIAEAEEALKNNIFIEKEYYFRALKTALENNDKNRFFYIYEDLHSDAKQQVKSSHQMSISQLLESSIHKHFAEEFQQFRERIKVEKYNPSTPDLYEFYNFIIKFYSKIMK